MGFGGVGGVGGMCGNVGMYWDGLCRPRGPGVTAARARARARARGRMAGMGFGGASGACMACEGSGARSPAACGPISRPFGMCGLVLRVLGCCLASSWSMRVSKKWLCRGPAGFCACSCCMVGMGRLGEWGGRGGGRWKAASAVIARARSGPQPCVRNVMSRRCCRSAGASRCVAWAVSRADGCGLLARWPMWHGAADGEVCAAPPRAAGRNRDGVLGTAHASGVAIADLLRNFFIHCRTHGSACCQCHARYQVYMHAPIRTRT